MVALKFSKFRIVTQVHTHTHTLHTAHHCEEPGSHTHTHTHTTQFITARSQVHTHSHTHSSTFVLLTRPTSYADQALRNGPASVRLSRRPTAATAACRFAAERRRLQQMSIDSCADAVLQAPVVSCSARTCFIGRSAGTRA